MSISAISDNRWTQRIERGQNKPSRADLRVSNARNVRARLVAVPEGVMAMFRYMRDNPLDFLVSTAISAASFLAVKAVFIAAFPALGVGLVAAMVTAATLGVGRSLHRQMKQSRYRVAALYEVQGNPSAADLAKARNIDVSEVVAGGIKRSLLTGIIGGLVGGVIGELLYDPYEPTGLRTEAEYQNFLEDVGATESKGNYQTTKNRFGFIGKYQFGEATLIDAGYFSRVDVDGNIIDPMIENSEGERYHKNDWEGRWTGKRGIDSKTEFLNTPYAQESAVREAMRLRWKEIERLGLDEYVGQEVGGVKITESGLLAGSWLKGVGYFEDGVAQNGLAKFLETGDLKPDGNGVHIKHYIKKFGGYAVPFEVGTPHQIQFLQPTSYDEFCQSSIDRIWPVDLSVKQSVSDYFSGDHEAVDIQTFGAKPDVFVTADGVVEKIGDFGDGYGKSILIRHEDGSSFYAHLSDYGEKAPNKPLQVGDFVSQGVKIGVVGNTGHTEGPTGIHLHYEQRHPDGTNYNPLPCIGASFGR